MKSRGMLTLVAVGATLAGWVAWSGHGRLAASEPSPTPSMPKTQIAAASRRAGTPQALDAVQAESQRAGTGVNNRRKVQFEQLRTAARAQGSVRVIVEMAVPNYDRLATASRLAKGPGPIALSDGQLSAAIASIQQAELAKLAGTAHTVNRAFTTIPFVGLSVSEQALAVLERSPGVVSITEDHLAAPSLDNTVNITGASKAWAEGFDGTGWYVAILDTGIRASHNFFAGKNIVQACFSLGEDGAPGAGGCPNGLSEDTTSPNAARHFPTSPTSDHGTHVSGIATGSDPTRVPPLYGIARRANIIAIQVFSQFFSSGDVLSYSSDQIAGMEHVYSLRATYNIASVNMSLGGGFYNDQAACDADNVGEKAAIDNLRGAGIATVIASGNNGYCDGISGPGCISTAVAVGATTDSDVEASFSNYYPTLLDLYAPGVNILSSVGTSDSSYNGSWSGTSMAAPHVAGAWAILRQANPGADVATILGALQSTGDPVSGRCTASPPRRRIQIDLAIAEILANFTQPPDGTGEAVASNIDLTDMAPNVVLADDFVSDGRPVSSVRWWGSQLDGSVSPDGWFVSFHEPLANGGSPSGSLGLYFCGASAVTVRTTSASSCDARPVSEYSVGLAACCLVHANVDSRNPGAPGPAQADAFHEQACFAYDIDIQAVVGHKFVDSGGSCVEVVTGNTATNPFWAWHTTGVERGVRSALQSVVSGSGPDWLYGPWANITPTCSRPNMAFQLLTNTSGGGDCNNNGIPDICESRPDCQPNGVFDECDIARGTSADCQPNGIPDECDIASLTSQDANHDGVPDECEGACCTCGACNNMTPSGCSAVGGTFSGLSAKCGEAGSCSPVPAPVNDVCAQATVLPSEPTVNEPFDNRCATLDGPATVLCPASQPFGADLWYKYVAPCTGTVTASQCGATNFDSIMDVYGGVAVCPCPTTSTGRLVCGDDTCGLGGGPAQVTFNVTAGMCYTIRVAGWADQTGTGVLNISYNTACSIAPPTPQRDSSGIDKSRFISFSVPGGQSPPETALRVKLTSLHHVDPPYSGGASAPFTLFESQTMYVGPPAQYVESASSGTPFYSSQLLCTPHYRNWSTIGLLHVTGEAIVPSSTYNVENLAASCAGHESSCVAVSTPLAIKTTRWGDVETPWNPPGTDPQPDTSDISALVNKFKSALGAPIKARALLAGGDARGSVGPAEVTPDFNFTHISLCVDAFKGLSYPYRPGKCTGDAAKACIADADCTAQSVAGPCILCP